MQKEVKTTELRTGSRRNHSWLIGWADAVCLDLECPSEDRLPAYGTVGRVLDYAGGKGRRELGQILKV